MSIGVTGTGAGSGAGRSLGLTLTTESADVEESQFKGEDHQEKEGKQEKGEVDDEASQDKAAVRALEQALMSDSLISTMVATHDAAPSEEADEKKSRGRGGGSEEEEDEDEVNAAIRARLGLGGSILRRSVKDDCDMKLDIVGSAIDVGSKDQPVSALRSVTTAALGHSPAGPLSPRHGGLVPSSQFPSSSLSSSSAVRNEATGAGSASGEMRTSSLNLSLSASAKGEEKDRGDPCDGKASVLESSARGGTNSARRADQVVGLGQGLNIGVGMGMSIGAGVGQGGQAVAGSVLATADSKEANSASLQSPRAQGSKLAELTDIPTHDQAVGRVAAASARSLVNAGAPSLGRLAGG